MRSCSMWRMTRAAATMVPTFHGQRLMLRRALKLVFSREFPRSPTHLRRVATPTPTTPAMITQSHRRLPGKAQCGKCTKQRKPPLQFGWPPATAGVAAHIHQGRQPQNKIIIICRGGPNLRHCVHE
jgi:hypothetical protein